MGWSSTSRMYGLMQDLRRRCNQDALGMLSGSDVLLMLYPPRRRGKDLAPEISKRERKQRHAKPRQQVYTVDETRIVQQEFVPKKKSLRVVWPEDRLMWEYFRRNPEIRQVPYELNSFEPPFPKRFALRQHELMQQGMTKEEAYKDVSREVADEKVHLLQKARGIQSRGGSYSAITAVQEAEELQLMQALEQYNKLQSQK